MAVSITTRCSGCGETLHTTKSGPQFCNKCRAEKKGDEKERYLAELDGLTIEERLRRVEKWVYAHSRKKHNQGSRGPKTY